MRFRVGILGRWVGFVHGPILAGMSMAEWFQAVVAEYVNFAFRGLYNAVMTTGVVFAASS